MYKTNSILNDKLNILLQQIADYDFTKHIGENNSGLFDGIGGVSLFYYYLGMATNIEKYYDNSMQLFEIAFYEISNNSSNFSLGSSGTMWLLNHFCKKTSNGSDYEDYLSKFDNFLSKEIKKYKNNIDPMHGVLGIANYFLERESPLSTQCLSEIVHVLDAAKEINQKGLLWKTNNRDPLKPEAMHVNFGYAHGILAILFFIAKIKERGVETDTCQELLEGGLKYFFSFQDDYSQDSIFPTSIRNGTVMRNPRMAYCYGDLGIASGLVAIGKILNDDFLLNISDNMSKKVAEKSLKNINKVDDIGVCHGAAGNGYMFERLFKIHNRDILKEAATLQYEKLLELRVEGSGIVGYTSAGYDNLLEKYYRKTDIGFINGVAGIGLSIISFLFPKIESDWDSILCFR